MRLESCKALPVPMHSARAAFQPDVVDVWIESWGVAGPDHILHHKYGISLRFTSLHPATKQT